MSELEDKILGKDKAKKSVSRRMDYFSTTVVWKVSKAGCGTTIMNGKMVYEMLSSEAKQKAAKGTKRILDKGFEFVRQ